MSKPHNLLIVISDEHRRDAMGCMGHPIVKTPHLDALAARGTVFDNAYTPSPMCVPTRAALACGEHVHRCRYWDSATAYEGKRTSWMHRVRDVGVEVTSIGKLHFRSGEDDNGWSEEILPMHVVGGVGWVAGLLRENPPEYHQAGELAADVGQGASTYTDYDRQITEAAEEWLKNRGDDPWIGFVSLVSPHYPLTAPEEFYALYDPDEMPLPVAYEPEARPDHPEIAHLLKFFDYDTYFDPAKLREAKAAYFGLCSFMDHCVGRVLAALEASGQADDTLVLYTSDHGEMLGDHGIWTKQVMYEASAGVPMILAGPSVPAGHRVKTGASLIDIAPTALELAGTSADLPGASLVWLANAPDDPDRTILSEYHDGGSSTGAFMVRWDRWKLVHYAGQPDQLFDLTADPDELTDLARPGVNDPVVQAAIEEGRRRLHAICDPDEVNAQAFADQAARIAVLGGEQACRDGYIFNHTPTPAEQAGLSEGEAL
ncbi:MAG: sulfatase-like hydrolase/transferase [Pseudomonadota bacterium]